MERSFARLLLRRRLPSATLLRRQSSRAAPPPPPHARELPRATTGPSLAKRSAHLWRNAAIGGSALFGLYLAYQQDFSLVRMRAAAAEAVARLLERNVGDPHAEDLQAALGPSPPEGYVTVLLAVEDVILRREWDRRFGWVYEPREGVKELLKALLDPSLGVWLTLWSENNMAVANEETEKLFQALGSSPAHTQPLGIEHMFLRDGNMRREKRLEYFNRDPATVLLIDHNVVSEQLNPSNTLLVQRMRGGGVDRVVDAANAEGPDTTCAAIKALVTRIREDVQATGQVNVPATLTRLRQEAGAAGFDTDTAGIFRFLGHAAAEEQAVERDRKERGLGGAVRRSLASSALLRNKLTTVEQAMTRPFRDPSAELGEDSLLVSRMREANLRLSRPQQ